MLNLHDTKDQVAIMEILNIGKTGEFWQLICQATDDAIKDVRAQQESEDMIALPADQYKSMNELLKAKINYLLSLKALPDNIIADMSMPDQSEPDLITKGVYD